MLQRYPSFQYALALLACAALVAPMSACDSIGSFTEEGEDAPDVELGRFEMVLSGALQDTLSGVAVFNTTVEEDSTGEEHTLFGLAFAPDSAESAAQSSSWFASQVVRASERPAEGEYEFAPLDENHFPDDPLDFPDELFAFSFQTEDTTRYAVVTSDEGTLNITNSSSTTLSGRFSVETSGMYYRYQEMEEPAEGSITIEGEFKALGGELAQ